MKLRTLLLVALVAGPACSKANDVPALEEQAHAIAKCQDAKIAELDKRGTAILRALEGRAVPGDVQQALAQAHDQVASLREIDAQLDTTSKTLAKDGRADELQKLVHDDRKKQETLDMVAEEDLT